MDKKLKFEDMKKRIKTLENDLDNYRKKNDELKELHNKYSTIIENANEAILVIQEGNFKFINNIAAKIAGFSQKETPNRSFLEWVHPADREMVAENHLKRLKGEKIPNVYDIRIIDKVQKVRWMNIRPVGIKWNKQPAVLIFMTDISMRKHAEEALRESEERFRNVYKTAPLAFVVWDKNTIVVDWNKKATKIFGWSKEEVLGRNFFDFLIPEKDRPKVEDVVNSLIKGDLLSHSINANLTKEGKIIICEWNNSPLHDDDGNITGAISLGLDITDRKRLENQLQQAQKMEAIGTLAGGIAHDFNNLLMGVLGNSSLLLADIDKTHPHYENLAEIEKYVKNSVDLTKQLLGFARGGMYDVKPTDINKLVKGQSKMFGRTKKEISIHEKYADNLWTAEVDQSQIEQVFMNIYVNAWQAMSDGGDLYVQTENVNIDENYTKAFEVIPGNYVRISITDTGIGINEEIQKKIFDPFFTTKDKERGTGMGLSSAYGIIKNHKGFINVYSEPGEGSTFTIYLPASEKQAMEDKESLEELLKGSGTVLLIDDEDMILNVGKKMLNRLGYDVIVVSSGQEAINRYKENRDKIKVVILDMIMPGKSGSETYDGLKEIDPDATVLLSSGYSLNGKAKNILNKGCDGFIQKPFNAKQLSQKINEILTRK